MPRVGSKRRTWRSEARTARGVPAALRRLGARVRLLRTRADLSQESLAERAKIDPKHLGDIERGLTNPTFATLFMIARALRAKVADVTQGV